MEVLTKIREASAKYDNTTTVDCRSMQPGQWFAQGDVQVERLDGRPSDVGDPWPSQQVVEGTTKGSRHVFDERAKLYHRTGDESELVGPYAYIEDESVLLHPEHRRALCGAGWHSVTYQRDFRMEGLRRVRD